MLVVWIASLSVTLKQDESEEKTAIPNTRQIGMGNPPPCTVISVTVLCMGG